MSHITTGPRGMSYTHLTTRDEHRCTCRRGCKHTKCYSCFKHFPARAREIKANSDRAKLFRSLTGDFDYSSFSKTSWNYSLSIDKTKSEYVRRIASKQYSVELNARLVVLAVSRGYTEKWSYEPEIDVEEVIEEDIIEVEFADEVIDD